MYNCRFIELLLPFLHETLYVCCDGEIVGSLHKVVVVAGIGELETFDAQTEAVGEAAGVETCGGLHFAHLSEVVAETQEERLADVELDASKHMTASVVEKLGGTTTGGNLAGEGVGRGGGVELIL